VIVAGTFKSPSFPLGGKTITNAAAGETDILISKFDTNGNFLWSKNFGGTAEDNVNSVCTDNDGNIYFCGYTRNTSLKFDSFTLPKNYLAGSQCFLVKLSANGNVIWVHTVDLINNNINIEKVIPISHKEIDLIINYQDLDKVLKLKTIYNIKIVRYYGKLRIIKRIK
jgi:hypothetical protein